MSERVGVWASDRCPRCNAEIMQKPRGRRRTWCSDRCRRLAHESALSAAETGDPVRLVRPDATPSDLDGAVAMVLGSPGACRRLVDELRRRESRGELAGTKWDAVVTALGPDPRKLRY